MIAIYVLNSIKLTKLRKNYSDFMTKLGKGNNINEMLQEYVKSVDEIKKENNEIERYCQKTRYRFQELSKKYWISKV